jgi:hypothetical protein
MFPIQEMIRIVSRDHNISQAVLEASFRVAFEENWFYPPDERNSPIVPVHAVPERLKGRMFYFLCGTYYRLKLFSSPSAKEWADKILSQVYSKDFLDRYGD